MRRGTVFLALALILVGTYFLLTELNVGLPGFHRIWPVFPFAGGIAFLGSYLLGHRQHHGLVFWGTGITLTGLFFSIFTIASPSPDYDALNDLWPVFVIIAGISFLALWLAQGLRDWGVLYLAIVALVFGGAALVVNLRPGAAPDLVRLWPVLVILVGLVLLARGLLGRRKARQ